MGLLKIIQPGMGVGVSNYKLANIASRNGCLGTVSGPGCEQQIARILQNGDPDGDIRRALKNFPLPEISEKIIKKYFVEGGIEKGVRYKGINSIRVDPTDELVEISVASAFVIVFLAKEGHSGLVSINFLEKIQMNLIHYIFGAMLAEVDVVTVGAGFPDQIPAVLNAISKGESPSYLINVLGLIDSSGKSTRYLQTFNTEKFFGKKVFLKRPDFYPIVSTNFVADQLVKKVEKENIQSFVVEKSSGGAGGHSANPRKVDGKIFYNEFNEPIYGEKDEMDFVKLKKDHNIPFYIAGGQASPEALQKALEIGASGIQVGSIFALCNESGIDESWKSKIKKKRHTVENLL